MGILLASADSGNIYRPTLLISVKQAAAILLLHGTLIYLVHADIFTETASGVLLLWHTKVSTYILTVTQ